MSSICEFNILINRDGTAVMIYRDEDAPFFNQGAVTITRASHVEPNPNGRGWVADMSLVDGPMLGPFDLRQQALDAEMQYLKELLF